MNDVMDLPYLGIRYQIKYHRCNLDCPYCIAHWKKFKEEEFELENFRRVLKGIKQLPYRISLRIGVGGEIFLSETILEEVRALCNEDNNIIGVSFSTNLAASWDKKILPFIQSVNIRKLGLGCTLHDTVIKSVDQFFDKLEKLHQMGVDLYVGYVAIPERINEIRAYKRRCDEIGVPLTMNGIHGKIAGVDGVDPQKIYPQAYTAQNRQDFRALWDTPHNYMMEVAGASPKGMRCSAGVNYIYIDRDGNVSTCGKLKGEERNKLGNIFTDTIQLKVDDTICTSNKCGCGNENQALRIIDDYYLRSHVLRLYVPKPEYSDDFLYSLYDITI